MIYDVPAGWELKGLQEISVCDPEESLKPDSIVKQINLDKLIPHQKYISGFEETRFAGKGSKFRNLDVLFPKILSALIGGKTALVTLLEDGEVGTGSAWFLVLRAIPQVSDPDFLYYLAITPWFRETAFKALEGTSSSQYINAAVFLKNKFPIPPYEEQRRIADTLSAIDRKIQKNLEACNKLEEILKRIFQIWFVDFNFPDRNGRPYKGSGGAFYNSDLGEIPCGWSTGCLSELGEIVPGTTPPRHISDYYASENGYPWITPKDLSRQNTKFIADSGVHITKKGFHESKMHLLPRGSVLFSSRAPIGYIAISSNDLTTNQGFRSIIPKDGIGSTFLYYLLLNKTREITNMASGTTFKEISGAELKKLKVVIPDPATLSLFRAQNDSLATYQENLEKENRTLTQIRNALLPLLISGRLRITGG
ncbi:MAG: restriction endonuclease subunit S [Lawsonibacter sp.]|nr:restriction endonuclease subunit S [Lawsonibacter sp.]